MVKHLQTVAAMACMKSFLMVFNIIFWVSANVVKCSLYGNCGNMIMRHIEWIDAFECQQHVAAYGAVKMFSPCFMD